VSTVLLDTSVASLLHPKKKGSSVRVQYDPHMNGQVLALSFQSVAELWAWAEENNWGDRQRAGLEAFLRRFLVIPYDFDLAKTWARVSAQSKRQGKRLETGDAWIVATALHRKIPLLTHDRDQAIVVMTGLEEIPTFPRSARNRARIAGVIVPDFPHHVVQRGVRRIDVFFSADNRQEYLDLLEQLIGTSLRRLAEE
jgi:tRNA(fMet)-specific endonuclease VapC